MPKKKFTALAALTALALSAAPASAQVADEPRLIGRAVLPAEATWPAPFAGIPNTPPSPAPGATQPVGGFSALLSAGRGRYWAMTDNGFGNRANSASFILRVYRVRPDFKGAGGGRGSVAIDGAISLRDPDRHVPWPITTEGTRDRLLTGADFDIESMRRGPDGDLWFGEEFGPFLLHTNATGRLLEPPIALPHVASPDNPLLLPGTPPNLGRSNGLEGMALAPNGRHLYPVLEGPTIGDPDPLRRWIFRYDTRRGRYDARRWQYRVEQPGNLVADFTALGGDRYLALERDNNQGPAAASKKVFVVDLSTTDADGYLVKREVLDLLDIADPTGLSLPARPGDFGLGNPFKLPYVTTESVLPLPGNRLALVNDTNFGSRGRNPDLPDYSDFIVVDVPALGGRSQG